MRWILSVWRAAAATGAVHLHLCGKGRDGLLFLSTSKREKKKKTQGKHAFPIWQVKKLKT
jgi:hypothetical protein